MPEEAAEDSAGPKQIFGVSTHNNTEEEGMSDDDCNDDDDAWGQSFRTTAAVAAIHSFIYLARTTGDIRSRSVLSYRYEGGRGRTRSVRQRTQQSIRPTYLMEPPVLSSTCHTSGLIVDQLSMCCSCWGNITKAIISLWVEQRIQVICSTRWGRLSGNGWCNLLLPRQGLIAHGAESKVMASDARARLNGS